MICSALPLAFAARDDHLRQLPHRESGRRQVLHRVRLAAGSALSELRDRQRAGCEVLQRMRDAISRCRSARRPSRSDHPGCPGGRATRRLDPLRRPGGLHSLRRGARRGGRPRVTEPVLRARAADRRSLRRHGREVHRGRRDGGLGRAHRPRGRRRTRCSGRARPRGGRPVAGGGHRGPRWRAHWGGGRYPRRHGPGHGRRRPGQHRLPAPVRRPARNRAGWRGHPARSVGRHHVRGSRRADAQGQERASCRLACRAGGWRHPRAVADRGSRGPVRRAPGGVGPAQGHVPRHRARRPGPAGLGRGPGGHRKEPAGARVPQPRRRRSR